MIDVSVISLQSTKPNKIEMSERQFLTQVGKKKSKIKFSYVKNDRFLAVHSLLSSDNVCS